MALFQLELFLWLFAFSILIDFSRSGPREKDFITVLKNIDRGRYSDPVHRATSYLTTENNYKKQLYKDVWCNYVITATVHLHLTKQFLVNANYRQILTGTQTESLTFTNEANQILTVVLNDEHDDCRHPITEVMWILLVYAELEQTFFSPTSFESLSQETRNHIIQTHNAVVKVLEEYIRTQNCKVFDPVSKKKVSDVLQLVKTSEISADVLNGNHIVDSLLGQIQENRKMFDKQSNHNVKLDARFYHRPHLKYHCLDNLLLKRLLEDDNDNIKNFEKFGIQLDLNAVADQLRVHYELGKNLNQPLYLRIRGLITFQQKCVHLMKVIAIRVIMRYLLNIQRMDDETLKDFVHNCVGLSNGKMFGYLKEFAVRFDITDDEYFQPVMDLMKKPPQEFFDRNIIAEYVKTLQTSLKHMPLGDIHVDTLMDVNDENSISTMNSFQKIISHYDFFKPAMFMFMRNHNSIKESIMGAEVLVDYVRQLTQTVPKIDFGAIKSFALVESSDIYNRLTQLELIINVDLIEL